MCDEYSISNSNTDTSVQCVSSNCQHKHAAVWFNHLYRVTYHDLVFARQVIECRSAKSHRRRRKKRKLVEISADVDLSGVSSLSDVIDKISNLDINYIKTDSLLYKLKVCEIPLTNINNMVGMDDVKNEIFYMFCGYFTGLNTNIHHMVIYGNPGTGKTTLARYISDLLCKMKILPTNTVKSVSRDDLFGQYLGHTTQKTQRVIDESLGGVLLIDEAYSLGDVNGRDTFANECLDTINRNLTENKNKFVCIIAGYKKEIETRLFASNPGLRRRFERQFSVRDYTVSELVNIMFSKLKQMNWVAKFEKDYVIDKLKKNMFMTSCQAGSMSTLIDKLIERSCVRTFQNMNKRTVDRTIEKSDLRLVIDGCMKKFREDHPNEINLASMYT